MATRAKAADVVHLFRPGAEAEVAEEVSVGRRLTSTTDTAAPVTVGPVADLSNRPKVLMTIGAGNSGKTTFLRWVAERATGAGSTALFAALDPENRELRDYFADVHEPPSYDPAKVTQWLETFLSFAMREKISAAIDFGGGDTTLGRLVSETPDIAATMEEAGVSPVAIYLLSPRLADLSPLATLEEAGFRPQATALVLNEGRADPTMTREQAFERTMKHSAFRAAIDRGAVQLWMPRLVPAKEVEDRRIRFEQARDAIMPEGRRVTPLGPFDRGRVRAWLARMEAEFTPISSWLL